MNLRRNRQRGGAPNRRQQQSNNGPSRQTVFDSQSVVGKFRGNANQLADRYQNLASDQRNNDRRIAESLQQYAEHYSRLQREFELERSQRDAARTEQRGEQPASKGFGNGSDDQPESSTFEEHKERRNTRPKREPRESRGSREPKESRESRESRETREVREPREHKERKISTDDQPLSQRLDLTSNFGNGESVSSVPGVGDQPSTGANSPGMDDVPALPAFLSQPSEPKPSRRRKSASQAVESAESKEPSLVAAEPQSGSELEPSLESSKLEKNEGSSL